MAEATNLEVTVDTAKGLERRMTVRVPNQTIEQQITTRLARVGQTAKLKGFRPGKVPQKVVRQRFGAEVRQEVLSEVIRSSYSEAIAQKSLRPAGGPAIEMLPEDAEHFGYQAVFEVYPEISLAPLNKITVKTPEVQINDTDIDEMIEQLRKQRADWQAVERKSKDGDRVVIDFTGRLGGEPFEGGEGKEIEIVIGEGQVIADFEKALKGLKAGDEKIAKVKFPADYGAANLAGQKAEFDISAHRVEEQVLPEVDAEFIEAFGVKEGGVEALREEVRGNMQRELSERLRAETKTQTLDALLEVNKIDVPAALVDDERNSLRTAAMQRMGITDAEQAPDAGQFQDLAQRRVALGLLVEQLINDNDIVLDRDRVDARIQELVSPYDKPEEAAQVYRTNRELMAQVESSVLEDQVVDFVLEKATAKNRKSSFKEFMNAK